MAHVGSRVLTLLQFTRAALVFTALADSLTALLLSGRPLTLPLVVVTLAMSGCLYAFGMSLNDLVDRRRDALLAATRPIPSGRLGLSAAHGVVAALAIAAVSFGLALTVMLESTRSAFFLLTTVALIVFYNLAGKYLVSGGIIALGLIRMLHACIAAPNLPVVFHGLWLFTHITILSTVAYALEEKRPRVTPLHSALISLAVVAINVAAIATVLVLRLPTDGRLSDIVHALPLDARIFTPIFATVMFILLGRRILRAVDQPAPHVPADTPLRERRRRAGQQLMLTGLLWLIVYDASFASAYASFWWGLVVLALLPCAYGAVRLMRAWASLISLTKPPEFRRARFP